MIAPPLVEFEIPGRVAEALKLENVRQVAVWAAVADRRFKYANTGAGAYRIQCSREMAECLIEAVRMRSRVDGEPSDMVKDCGLAIDAAQRALSGPALC